MQHEREYIKGVRCTEKQTDKGAVVGVRLRHKADGHGRSTCALRQPTANF
jgi:hypothetical protein